MNKVLYSTVIYPCENFDTFIKDYLDSVFNQTNQNFDLLIVLDSLEKEVIEKYINKYNKVNKNILLKSIYNKTPIELREELIKISYKEDVDILIFSDFDETFAADRVEKIIQNIAEYSFVFNNFIVTDNDLNVLDVKSFYQNRNIKKELLNIEDILYFNYVGFGNLAINLKAFDYMSIKFPKNIIAMDWFLASFVLINGGRGLYIEDTFVYYRQHSDSLVGINFKLNKQKLEQGLMVKKLHYQSLILEDNIFKSCYSEILELEKYLQNNGIDKYIKFVNTNFDTSKFCWWENIKTIKELEL